MESYAKKLGKNIDYKIDGFLSTGDMILMLSQLFFWLLRGSLYKMLWKDSKGHVFIGRGVRIRYPKYLSTGKNFIIEDFAEIMALSRRGITAGDNVTIGSHSMIKPTSYYGDKVGEGLRIGDNSNIGRYSFIGCSGFIEIGKNVMMGPRVSFFAENHNFRLTGKTIKSQGVIKEDIVVEDNCWIASGVTILAGTTIGEGSIIAAGSVVNKDVSPYTVVAGVPARLIRERK